MIAVLLWTPVVLGTLVGMTILRGAVLQALWTWFAVPDHPGRRRISSKGAAP